MPNPKQPSRNDPAVTTKTAEIDTAQLLAELKNPNTTVIDTRPIAAYNGWALHDEPRGGHIKGARTFPFRWTEFDEWPDRLKAKGITPDRRIIVYGYTPDETGAMADLLNDINYRDLRVYNRFLDDWSAKPDSPMDFLPRFEQLVHPDWLSRRLTERQSAGPEGDNFVLGHASYGFREDYEESHLPGAVYVDTLSLESEETWNRVSPELLRQNLLKLGIRHDTTVVMYGRFSHPKVEDPFPGINAGHIAAMRCAAIMLYAGVRDVRVLNGGLVAWVDAGYKLTTEEEPPTPADDFGIKIPGRPEFMVDTPEAKEVLASDNAELVSVRSWDEFIGEKSGYNYIGRAGRIPGAVFGNCGSDAYHMENYRNIDHTMREYHEVEANWAEVGVVPGKHCAFYCGTGWRASEAFINAYLMNWPRISVYDGGWFEWSNNQENPVESGVPQYPGPPKNFMRSK